MNREDRKAYSKPLLAEIPPGSAEHERVMTLLNVGSSTEGKTATNKYERENKNETI